MSTPHRVGGRARLRVVLPDNQPVPPADPAPATRAVLGDVRNEDVLIIGPRGLEVMCDLVRRGARSVTLLRLAKRPEAGSASLVVVPETPSIEWLACVLAHARRALLPTGRLVLRVGAMGGHQVAAQIMRMLRLHGYTGIVVRRFGGQLLLNAELPCFGQQIRA